MLLTLLSLAIIVVGALFYVRHSRVRSIRTFPGPPRSSLVTGNLEELFGPSANDFVARSTSSYGRIVKVNGLLGDIQLLVTDTKALTYMLVKGPEYFDSDDYLLSLGTVAFGPGLLGATGKQHDRLRNRLLPFFTTQNLRSFSHIFTRVTLQFQDKLRDMIAHETEVEAATRVDVVTWASRLSLELIGVVAFGHSFESYTEDGKNEYSSALSRFFPTFTKMQRWAFLLPLVTKLASPTLLRRIVEMTPWKTLHEFKDIIDTLERNAVAVMEELKLDLKSDLSQSSIGDGEEGLNLTSVFRMVLKSNYKMEETERLTDAELTAQINTILFAGSDTISVIVSRILLLLANHSAIQDKLRVEIFEAGALEYDRLMALPYLDAVCKETLRLHPSTPITYRQAQCDNIVPFSDPVTCSSGVEVDHVFVPKGTICAINIVGVNRDPLVWGPDALEWKPERWLAPLPESVAKAQVPSLYANTMTFTAGNRGCIGSKFARLAIKTVIANLISEFNFAGTDDEIYWTSGSGSIVSSPSTSHSGKPSLPLFVSFARKD